MFMNYHSDLDSRGKAEERHPKEGHVTCVPQRESQSERREGMSPGAADQLKVLSLGRGCAAGATALRTSIRRVSAPCRVLRG